ncbi:MAG TPA: sigma-70 family RNA polymerase sigma factor [Pirellulales bacterium]
MALEQATVVRVLLAERAKLLAYIWSIVRDEHAVEDVFQEVSILAVEKCGQINDENALWPWLRQTAKFRALHAVRARGNSLPLSEELLDQLDLAWQGYDDLASSALVESLVHCVGKLSHYAQRIVALRYVDGLSGIEVAARLHREVHTIYVALTRIHNSLRRCVQDRMAAIKVRL